MGEEVSAPQRCLEMREELQKCCPMEQGCQGDGFPSHTVGWGGVVGKEGRSAADTSGSSAKGLR